MRFIGFVFIAIGSHVSYDDVLPLRFTSDFCAGGEGMQSPIGTMRDMIEQNGYNRTSLPWMSLDYYGSVSRVTRLGAYFFCCPAVKRIPHFIWFIKYRTA